MLVDLLPELRAYSRALARDAEIAEDAVSDALESAARSPAIPLRRAELRRWMFRVIRNKQIDAHRHRRVRRDHAGAVALQQTQPCPSDPEARAVMRDALRRLCPRDRTIIELVDIHGLTYAEAARHLGIPAGTVMSRLSRARRALIAILTADEGGRPGC